MPTGQNHPEDKRQPSLPTVAVIIPCHNYGHTVMEAATSAAEQDYARKMIVIVNDGSTDDTAAIVLDSIQCAGFREIEREDMKVASGRLDGVPTLFIEHKEARGPSATRNTALKAVFDSAHFFAMLDADDYWLQGKISRSIAKFLEFPERIGAVYTDNLSLNVDTNNIIREFREPYNRDRLLKHNMIHSGCIVSRLALQKVGVYDENLRVAEDLDLWLRISDHFIITHIPEALVVARVHSKNSSNSVDRQVWEQSWKYIAEKVRNRNASGR